MSWPARRPRQFLQPLLPAWPHCVRRAPPAPPFSPAQWHKPAQSPEKRPKQTPSFLQDPPCSHSLLQKSEVTSSQPANKTPGSTQHFPGIFSSSVKTQRKSDGCPTFAKAYVGRRWRREAPTIAFTQS